MGIFSDLEGWANMTVVEINGKSEVYYRLYISKILSDLPVLGSKSSVSRCITELEEKGIIESINKRSAPAYRLTELGLSWKRKPQSVANDGKTEASKARRKDYFHLSRETQYRNLTEEYKRKLHAEMTKLCNEHKIPNAEINQFIFKKDSQGDKHLNWKSAFRYWIGNKLKWDQQRLDSEENKNGLYR